ncbi:MAG: methylenetetrahydrofolate--tRNA-(uracil(54)-C(5))-methyltransferase (FADH(2)-oxidizing) TrmFO [Deltaproteobacteria bacterium]|nr:methylenetetrahydrofolate--tRNA-(uracil(54)-C(5))-methyltransferase (FADH(2)-oxidizing) TrmFO [Deltaproteobacteria bacterium]
MTNEVTIIGGGLAGAEAAYQIHKRGGRAVIIEEKPARFSPAHSSPMLAELVCSNSLKSDALENAAGLLKEEMRLLDSLVLKAAQTARVPAGKTLAVDRGAFSEFITAALDDAGARVVREEATAIPGTRPLIIATGPLTSDAFAQAVSVFIGREGLYFYDAVAPIVYKDGINMDKAFFASRYGKGGDDYINCPLDTVEYERFYNALVEADKVNGREFEDIKIFEGCMPIEVMAERGAKTLVFGPMKPVGLIDPKTGGRPYAALQLRRENTEGTLYNMVGFQTRLKFPEQKKVFRLIPALESAEFARLGKLHRNSYIDSPRLLFSTQQLRKDAGVFFAGQITGVEGYCESAASGLLAGINALRVVKGFPAMTPPASTITGALMRHISNGQNRNFSPMNANMGLLPDIPGRKKDKREAQVKKALEDFRVWSNEFTRI